MVTVTPGMAKDIADRLNIKLDGITAANLARGIKVEHGEHKNVVGGSLEAAAKIAHAHLKERPDYYQKLEDMEKSPRVPYR